MKTALNLPSGPNCCRAVCAGSCVSKLLTCAPKKLRDTQMSSPPSSAWPPFFWPVVQHFQDSSVRVYVMLGYVCMAGKVRWCSARPAAPGRPSFGLWCSSARIHVRVMLGYVCMNEMTGVE
jgi:hypothetical protein